MNMGEEVSHLKAHVNTFYNNGALQRASEQPHLKTNQKPSQINKKVGSQEKVWEASQLRTQKSLLILFAPAGVFFPDFRTTKCVKSW
ncbi:hypothetical protein [Ruegeria sp.]|uniref:hypothetical protein n=1 Tax=Ruegeria sp. TaxID=1879320 RepID=UPI003B00668C